jgi:glutamyl-tRNA reductase
LQSAFAAAKKVRSETEIGSTTVSIASVAVDLAQKIFGSLAGKRVFLVGAGKMSELAARHLIRHGAGKILVTNRTQERAVQMAARFAGSAAPQVIPWEQMHDAASSADIVITSTGASEPIFRREAGQAFLHKRKNRPMFFIDIAVPRDVDPEMNRLEGIFLYDIDDLQSVAAAHLAERTREAADAEAMIAAEVERYHLKLKAVNVAPAIVGLQQRAEELRLAELKRVQSRLGGLTAEQFAAVEALSRGLVNKFLHPPMQALKQAAREGDLARIEAIRETYALGAETEVAGIVAEGPSGAEPPASVSKISLVEEPVVEKVGS